METIRITVIASNDRSEIGRVIDMPVVADSELSAQDYQAWYGDKPQQDNGYYADRAPWWDYDNYDSLIGE